jgi:hypothetical protein
MDSNHRPQGYEPCELPTAPPCNTHTRKISSVENGCQSTNQINTSHNVLTHHTHLKPGTTTMMYLSKSKPYIIAIELDDTFIDHIKNAHNKLSNLGLDISTTLLNFDNSKARLIEHGFEPYEDRQTHMVNNGEGPLDYYGYHISKYYFPTQEYWDDHEKPQHVYLEISGRSIGFRFWHKTVQYEGMLIYIEDWESYFTK